jgi:hypothetical protein
MPPQTGLARQLALASHGSIGTRRGLEDIAPTWSGLCAEPRSPPWTAVAELPPLLTARRPPGEACRARKGGSCAAALQGGLQPRMPKLQAVGSTHGDPRHSPSRSRERSPFRVAH